MQSVWILSFLLAEAAGLAPPPTTRRAVFLSPQRQRYLVPKIDKVPCFLTDKNTNLLTKMFRLTKRSCLWKATWDFQFKLVSKIMKFLTNSLLKQWAGQEWSQSFNWTLTNLFRQSTQREIYHYQESDRTGQRRRNSLYQREML